MSRCSCTDSGRVRSLGQLQLWARGLGRSIVWCALRETESGAARWDLRCARYRGCHSARGGNVTPFSLRAWGGLRTAPLGGPASRPSSRCSGLAWTASAGAPSKGTGSAAGLPKRTCLARLLFRLVQASPGSNVWSRLDWLPAGPAQQP